MPVTVRQRNLQTRQVGRKVLSGKITAKKAGGSWKSNKKNSASEVLVTNAPTDSAGIMFPTPWKALLCLLAARLSAATWVHITDCDETFNYWEPLHFLIYGSGMQTWEYSPAYAIRSYAPLYALAAPARVLRLLLDVSPMTLFYVVRYTLAIFSAVCEAVFYKAVCQQFGVNVGRMWLVVSMFSCGGFISSAALVPSAWCGALVTGALSFWWLNMLPAAVVFTALAALVAWPFAGLLGAPIAIDFILYRKRYADFIKWCCISLLALLPPLVAIDSWFYGKLTLAPWNIVRYNIFTEHGPDLYGVEPWTYYILNGFLNFNIVWVMALLCPALLGASALLARGAPRLAICRPYWLSLSPLYLWLAVFVAQPHKEERFLFPVYSMICLCGAISIDCIQKITFTLKMLLNATFDKYITKKEDKSPVRRHYLSHTNFVMVIFLSVAVLGGTARIAALYRNYHAPMSILRSLPATSDPNATHISVCFGKDWYRAPSSFFLPSDSYRMRFIKSEFKGQLPAQYATSSNATSIIPEHFNDRNEEDSRTYLHPGDCHYLVDSDVTPPTSLQPNYVNLTRRWSIVDSLPFLNVEESHKLFRAFYVPFVGDGYTKFGHLYLLKNKILVSGE